MVKQSKKTKKQAGFNRAKGLFPQTPFRRWLFWAIYVNAPCMYAVKTKEN